MNNKSNMVILLLVCSLIFMMTGCGGGGSESGSDSTVYTIPPDNKVLAGVNNLAGSNGNFVGDLPNFTANEEAILITSIQNTIDTTYSYNLQANKEGVTTAPSTTSAAPQKSVVNQTNMVHSRFRNQENATALLSKMHPAPAASFAPSRQAVPHTVGEKVNFWSLNSLNWPPNWTDWTYVTATCKAVGNNCYLFEDDNIGGSYQAFPASAWAEIVTAVDTEIYPKVTAAFGEEPRPPADRDGDSRIYFLFTPNVNRQRASGYFDSTNELTQAQASALGGGLYYSNQKEMMYMQVGTSSYNWYVNGFKEHIFGVMAHEFLHMIVYNQHVMKGGAAQNEENWLNEGLAQVAQDVSGYGYQYGTLSFVIDPFLTYPSNYSLTNFHFSLGQYGMAYLFARYLADQGVSTKSLTSTLNVGTHNVSVAAGRAFNDIFSEWCTALYLSNSGVSSEPRYNYTSINLRARQNDGIYFSGPRLEETFNTLPFSTNQTLRGYGVRFTKIKGGDGRTVAVSLQDATSAGLEATMIRLK